MCLAGFREASNPRAHRAYRTANTTPVAGSRPGYLRYAVRDTSGRRTPSTALGIVKPYPRTLLEQVELRPILAPGEPATPGAAELRRTLFTLPTHHFVSGTDVKAIAGWLQNA